MLKSELRQQMKVLKRQFTSNQLREQSLALVNKVLNHPRVNAAKTILLYYSMADEVDTHNLVDLLREQGKTVLLPVTLAHELEIPVWVSTHKAIDWGVGKAIMIVF